MKNTRLELQEQIRECGLKAVQIEWESNVKPLIEEVMRNIEYYQSIYDLTGEEKREGKERFKEFIETIERDLYPDRNKGGSGWIWLLVILGLL